MILVGQGSQLSGEALSTLQAQTYPRSLIDVLLHGEPPSGGSELADLLDELEVSVVGDGRSAGEAADGEVLVFLGADSLHSPRSLEAHVRWHESVSDAVVLGQRCEIAPAPGADAVGLVHALSEDRGGDLVAELSERPEPWQKAHLERTRDLADGAADVFMVGLGGNHSMRGETFRAVGGHRVAAGNDSHGLELAYRLAAFGAVFVLEREAVSWRVVDELRPPDGEDGPKNAPELVDRVALGGLRPTGRGRIFATPAVAVTFSVVDEPAEVVAAAVDTALGGRLSDLAVRLEVADGYTDRAFLERSFASDPRVSITGQDAPSELGACAYQVLFPPSAVPDTMTFQDIYDVVTEEPLGALYVTVPGRPAGEAVVRVFLTGALARSRRVAADENVEVEPVIAELFGERWISGVEVGVRDWREPEPRLADQGPLASNPELVRERARAAREKARAEQAKASAERERAEARDQRARTKAAEAESEDAAARAEEAEAEAAAERAKRRKAADRLDAVQRSRTYRLARLMSRSSAVARRRMRRRRSS